MQRFANSSGQSRWPLDLLSVRPPARREGLRFGEALYPPTRGSISITAACALRHDLANNHVSRRTATRYPFTITSTTPNSRSGDFELDYRCTNAQDALIWPARRRLWMSGTKTRPRQAAPSTSKSQLEDCVAALARIKGSALGSQGEPGVPGRTSIWPQPAGEAVKVPRTAKEP